VNPFLPFLSLFGPTWGHGRVGQAHAGESTSTRNPASPFSVCGPNVRRVFIDTPPVCRLPTRFPLPLISVGQVGAGSLRNSPPPRLTCPPHSPTPPNWFSSPLSPFSLNHRRSWSSGHPLFHRCTQRAPPRHPMPKGGRFSYGVARRSDARACALAFWRS